MTVAACNRHQSRLHKMQARSSCILGRMNSAGLLYESKYGVAATGGQRKASAIHLHTAI